MNHAFTTLVFLLISINSYSQITQGLVLHYDLNGDAIDRSSNNNHGILNNTSLAADFYGTPDSAVYFNGASSVILPNNPSIKPQFPFSFRMLVKFDNLNANSVPLYHSDLVANNYVGFFINAGSGGRLGVHLGSNLGTLDPDNRRSYVVNSPPLSVGNWHRITIVIRSYNDIRTFIDCVEASGTYSGTGSTTMTYSNALGRIGEGRASPSFPSGYFLNGSIDEVVLWDRALTDEEITDICDGRLTSNELKIQESFEIFPNPSKSKVNISFDETKSLKGLQLILTNSVGQVLKNVPVHSNKFILDVEGLSAGFYHISLFNKEKILARSQLILQ